MIAILIDILDNHSQSILGGYSVSTTERISKNML